MAIINQDMREVIERAMLGYVATICYAARYVGAAGFTPDDLATAE